MVDTREFLLEKFLFCSGFVAARDRIVLLAHYEPAIDDDVAIAQVVTFDGAGWQDTGRFKWGGVALLLLPDATMVLGRDGEVGVIGSDGVREEHLNPDRAVGPTRGLLKIDREVLAFGMNREIFRRMTDGTWVRWNDGMRQPPPKPGDDINEAMKLALADIGGINAITGPTLDELYAFGMGGEIWRRGASRWTRVDSPTNVSINDATLGSDGMIYVCGQNGLLMRGIADQWDLLDYEGPGGLDFCAIESFNDNLFIADGHSLRNLTGESLEVVELDPEQIVPSSHLHSNDGLLLSVAGKEIFTTVDGENWSDLLR